MAQTGYTPILIYSSSTASNAPAVGNLTNSTLGSELAINITDGKLFYKDNANAIQVIGWKTTPTTAGGTGLTSYTAGDLLYYATGTTLSKLAIGASTTILTSSGTAPQWSAASGVTVGTATNLAGGVAGSVPYQSGAGATTFLGIGAANTVLTSSGSAPQWSTSLSLASSVTATTFIPTSGTAPTNGMYLYSANTLGWATNSSFRMQLGTGGLSINTTASNAQLTILSQLSNTGIPSAGNATAWLMNDPGSVVANAGGALSFAARTRASPNEIQAMAGLKGAKLNANDDEIAGYLAFYTANNIARALAEQMRLWNTGGLSLGNTTDPGAGNIRTQAATANYLKLTTSTAAAGTCTNYFEVANNFSGISQSFVQGIGPGNSGVSQLSFGVSITSGATTATDVARFDTGGNFRPSADNAYSCGTGALRWSVIYSATALINTSDGTLKTIIGSIDDAEKRVAQKIKAGIKKFKFNDSIAEKGEAARIHWGVVAQDVQAAFADEGLNAEQYGMFCSDTWFEKDGKKVLDDVGEIMRDGECPEGAVKITRLGVRYEELLTFVIASM